MTMFARKIPNSWKARAKVRMHEESDQDRQGHVLECWLRAGAALGGHGEKEIGRLLLPTSSLSRP
jgi:hypothetical protein